MRPMTRILVASCLLAWPGAALAGQAADEAARAEACEAFLLAWNTRLPAEGDWGPLLSTREQTRDRCLALGGSAVAYYARYLAGRRRSDARPDLDAAIALDPDNAEYLFERGAFDFEWTGETGGEDIDRALRMDETADQISPGQIIDPHALDALVAGGFHDGVVRLTSRQISVTGDNAGVRANRALALLSLGRADEALADMETAFALHGWGEDFLGFGDVFGPELYLRRALVLIGLQRGPEALSDIEEAIRRQGGLSPEVDYYNAPREARLALILCRAAVEAGDARRGLEECGRLSDYAEDHDTLQVELGAYQGLAYERLGDRRRARRAYRRALDHPPATGAFNQVGRLLYEDALRTAREGLARLD